MIKPKMLPVWMVGFAFLHFGLSVLAARSAQTVEGAWTLLSKLLSFPLLHAAPSGRVEAALFANSVLWALLFAATMIVLGRRKPE